MMTRKGFLGAVIGAPWLGWVTKLDVRGEPTLKAVEPTAEPAAFTWDNSTSWTTVATTSADTIYGTYDATASADETIRI